MAQRFWNLQNASPNWNATAPTNWGSASNTADSVSVPDSTSDVFFDGVGGGANNATLSASISVNSIDMTGYANTLTHNSSVILTVAGNGVNFKLATGMTYTKGSNSTSKVLFSGTSGTTLITSNGKAFGSVTLDGIGGTWQAQDAMTVNGTLTLTNGTFDNNSQSSSFGNLSSSNANIRTLTLGASAHTISLTVATTATLTFSTSTNLTFNAGGSTIKFTANSSSGTTAIWGTGLTFNNVWVATSGTGVFSSTGTTTMNNLKLDAGRTMSNVTSGDTLTISSLTAVGTAGAGVITLQSGANGQTWNLSKASGIVSCDYLSLRDSAAAGGATFYAGANSTNTSGNSGWIFTAAPTGANATAIGSMTGVGSITL